MRIVFLDIDGVLQPTWSRNRFEHINEIEDVARQLEAKNPGYDFDSRASEIRDYLDQHPEVTSYVAIDDRRLGFPVEGHFVHVRHGELGAEDCKLAKTLLQQEDGPYLLPKEIFETTEI